MWIRGGFLEASAFAISVAILLVSGYSWILHRSRSRRDAVKLFHSSVPAPLHVHGNPVVSADQSVGDADSNLVDLVRTKCTTLCGPHAGFKGVWWLPGGHAQTMYCSLGDFSKVDHINYERKLLQIKDGGTIAVDVTPPFTCQPAQSNEHILFVTHGLTGGSHESYVRAALKTLTRSRASGGLGLRTVVMNFRGCNESPVTTPRLYHAGSSDDVRPVVLWICRTFPSCQILGLGFSLGANILTKYAGEEGDSCPLSCVVGLANVWDFVKGSSHIERGTFANRLIYRNVLGNALRALLQLHKNVFLSSKSPLSPSLLRTVFRKYTISLREYDELVTAPLYGFANADDYYRSISSSAFISGIRIPCLSINSLDDPIVGTRNLPVSQVSKSPWMLLATTRGGGHMGWFERDPISGELRRWYVEPVREFIAAIIDCGLKIRPIPEMFLDEDGFWVEKTRIESGFKEIDVVQTIESGSRKSKLFSGW